MILEQWAMGNGHRYCPPGPYLTSGAANGDYSLGFRCRNTSRLLTWAHRTRMKSE
jgi:hypothetical protein